MKILLDTHVFIWWDDASPALTHELHDVIADAANEIYVSAASVWEIAIKRRRGRITFEREIGGAIAKNGFLTLSIAPAHAEHAGGLPLHHRDPFDRILIAQSVLEGMALATQDMAMSAYGAVTIGLR